MKILNKRLMPNVAVVLALMIGLTGCGASLAETGAKSMEETMTASEKADVMTEAMTSSEKADVKTEAMTSSEKTDMKAEAMTSSEAVTYEMNFALMDLDGKTVTLNDHEGKKIYVKFWGTWCPICLSGLDELEAFAALQNAGTEVAVITIVAPGVNGEFETDEFKAWYERKGYTFPVLFDEGGKVLQNFKVRAFPTSMVFEKDGKLSTNRPGHIKNEELEKLLNSEP